HRALLVAADVEDLPVGGGVEGDAHGALHGVLHEGEAARGVAPVVEERPLAAQRLADALRDDEVGRLARPVDVEEAHDARVEPLALVHGEDEMLAHGLAGAVAPALGGGGPQDAVVLLGPRDLGVLAVDLARAGEEDLGARLVGGVQHVARAQDVHVEHAQRVLHVVLDAHDGAQVEDHLGARRDGVRDLPGVAHVALHEVEPAARLGAVEVAVHAHVEDGDVVPLGQEAVHEVGADEARAPGDDDLAHRPIPRKRRPSLRISAIWSLVYMARPSRTRAPGFASSARRGVGKVRNSVWPARTTTASAPAWRSAWIVPPAGVKRTSPVLLLNAMPRMATRAPLSALPCCASSS